MLRMISVCFAVASIGAACRRPPSPQTQGPVTYYKDVKPLVDERCIGCHSDGNIAFSLTDYKAVSEKKSAVKNAIESKRMPIWLAADGHEKYREDPSFSPEQIEIVRQWAAQGYPEGNPTETPKGDPNVGLFDLDADVTLPLQGPGKNYLPNQEKPDDYHCFMIEWPYVTKETFMVGFQAVPGNSQVVHHLVAYMLDPKIVGMIKELDNEESGDGFQCFGGAMPDRLGDPAVYKRMLTKYPEAFENLHWGAQWLGHWAPGMKGFLFPEGTGLPLHPGGVLVVQIHYYTRTAPHTADSGSEIRLKLAEQVAKPSFVVPLSDDDWLAGPDGPSLIVPPGETITVSLEQPMQKILERGKAITGVKDVKNLEIHSVNLHMHSYGKSAETSLVNKVTGAKDVLLEIPAWNLNWQRDYTLSEPKILKASDLESYRYNLSCTYENRTDKRVVGGLGSDDEMCFNFSFLALDPQVP